MIGQGNHAAGHRTEPQKAVTFREEQGFRADLIAHEVNGALAGVENCKSEGTRQVSRRVGAKALPGSRDNLSVACSAGKSEAAFQLFSIVDPGIGHDREWAVLGYRIVGPVAGVPDSGPAKVNRFRGASEDTLGGQRVSAMFNQAMTGPSDHAAQNDQSEMPWIRTPSSAQSERRRRPNCCYFPPIRPESCGLQASAILSWPCVRSPQLLGQIDS